MNKISAEDVVNPETGEVFVKAGEKISYEVAKNIQNAGINVVTLLVAVSYTHLDVYKRQR